ncbi:type II secretion system protein [Aquipseudomonas alcaligenes]|uniref:Type II secretion system protein n=1 Tax=Aquipseudomonas alcaligenes TaxID=43263 RepID=A0A2V4KV08_AQUAC|nr:type II secretion system protein [Pseudomonas alcaligenes]PYC23628.1 type II secretion system protein [Pseudomonas alcaligenes]
MKNSKGFTLIELVVVIAILGILAAVALPRFMDATKDAHESALRGTSGTLASAVLLARSQYELNRNGGSNGCTGGNCQIDVAGFGNGTVDVNANGWPIGVNATGTPAATAAMSAATCNEVFTNVLQGSAPSVGTAAGTVDYVTTAAGTTCTFTYQADGADDTITYNANTGEVTNTFN